MWGTRWVMVEPQMKWCGTIARGERSDMLWSPRENSWKDWRGHVWGPPAVFYEYALADTLGQMGSTTGRDTCTVVGCHVGTNEGLGRFPSEPTVTT